MRWPECATVPEVQYLSFCRYLYVEWEDPAFGPRAAAVHKRLQEGLTSTEEASHSMAAISAQMGLVAQLRHIANELKVKDQ